MRRWRKNVGEGVGVLRSNGDGFEGPLKGPVAKGMDGKVSIIGCSDRQPGVYATDAMWCVL